MIKINLAKKNLAASPNGAVGSGGNHSSSTPSAQFPLRPFLMVLAGLTAVWLAEDQYRIYQTS